MMKKIGIITIVKCNNYGAELQACALQKKLSLMGFDAEIIDYLFYKHPQHIREAVSAPFFHFPLKKRIKEYVLPLKERLQGLLNRKATAARASKFSLFHQKNTRFSDVCYRSYSQLYANPPAYDVYCVGSDQVWNPSCFTSLNPYFLTFAPMGKRRISYASSFGVASLPQDARAEYKKCLNGLDCISVREEAGSKLVADLTGREAMVVADPTLLLSADEWLQMANTQCVPAQDYILLYVLKDSDYITEVAQCLSRQMGLPIVRLCKGAAAQDNAASGIKNIMDAAPDDYLGLFSRAKVVLTNSFHGTVFSLIFQRDFYTILKKGKDNNSRQINLLGRVGLDERIVYEGEFGSFAPVDFSQCAQRIEAIRKESEEYLVKAIGD